MSRNSQDFFQHFEPISPEPASGDFDKKGAVERARYLFAQKKVDWIQAQEIFSHTLTTAHLKEIYAALEESSHKKGSDYFMFNAGATAQFLEFMEKFGEQCAHTEEGAELLKQIIQQDKFPNFFSTVYEGSAESFEPMRAKFITALFNGNKEQATDFAVNLLPQLETKTRQFLKAQRERYAEEGEDEENFPRERYTGTFDESRSAAPHEREIWHEAVVGEVDELYPYSTRAILSGIAEAGASGNVDASYIDPLIKYLKNDLRAANHTEELACALQNINSAVVARKLLEIIRNGNENPFTKKLATNILYRLEFGRIGVSQKGVEYLNRLYNLYDPQTNETVNNPAHTAFRLTRNGEIGIFDEQNILIRYFKLGDMANNEQTVKAAALPIAYWMFSIARADATEEETAQLKEDFEKIRRDYFSYLGDSFFKDTGVAFNNFSFLEQGKFIRFVEQADDEKKQKAFEFVKKYGEEGFRAFLGLEYGEEYGEVLFDIGNSEHISNDQAHTIFKRYNALNDQAMLLGEQISKSPFFEEVGLSKEISISFIEQFTEGILRRAKDMLNTAQSIARNGKAEALFFEKQMMRCENPDEVILALSHGFVE